MDYPFVENSSKTINLIFQAFPYLVSPYQGTLLGQPTHMRGAAKKLWVLVRFLKPFGNKITAPFSIPIKNQSNSIITFQPLNQLSPQPCFTGFFFTKVVDKSTNKSCEQRVWTKLLTKTVNKSC